MVEKLEKYIKNEEKRRLLDCFMGRAYGDFFLMGRIRYFSNFLGYFTGKITIETSVLNEL